MLSRLRLRLGLSLAGYKGAGSASRTRDGSLVCLSALHLRGLKWSAGLSFSTLSVSCFNGVNFVQSRGSCLFQNQASSFSFLQKRNFCTNNESNDNSKNNSSKQIDFSALSIACKFGDIEKVRQFLKLGMDVNGQSAFENPPLITACENGQFAFENPPLITACGNGHLEIVKFLIENGANVNILGHNRFTPLLVAINQSHFEIAELLLQRHADPNLKAYIQHEINPLKADAPTSTIENSPTTQNTPNSQQTHNPQNTENTQNNTNPQSNPNTQNTENTQNTTNPPLGPMFSFLDDKNVLSQYRTDPSSSEENSDNPDIDWPKMIQKFDKCVETNTSLTDADKAFLAQFRELLEIKISNPQDANGTPFFKKMDDLVLSVFKNPKDENEPFAKSLFRISTALTDEMILNNYIKREFGITALHIACARNDEKIFDLLLRYGANLNVSTDLCQLPIHLTRKRSIIEKILRISPSHVHTKGARGLTPLHWAVLRNDIDLTLFLLKKGAVINAKDDHGRTPLELCPSKEFQERVFKWITSK